MTVRKLFGNVTDYIVTENNGKILKMEDCSIYIEKDDSGGICIPKEIIERYDAHHFQLKEDQDKILFHPIILFIKLEE
jgi:predicted short-subunit dehydrogenase-like oxidoreductase (DUF2520 family)